MAKKRSGASHRRSASGGGTPSWKNSKPLAIVLIVVIVIVLFNILGGFSSNRTNIIPSNFPWAYLATEDNGNYKAVLIERSSRQVDLPFEQGGKKYWEAHICMNEHCPGRTGDKKTPYIFASVVPEKKPLPENATPEEEEAARMLDMGVYIESGCPLCLAKWKKAPEKYKRFFDPMNNERYMTDEAKQILRKLREDRKKNK